MFTEDALNTLLAAVYPCPLSYPWQQWAGVNGKPQSQKAFIDFLDLNMPEIVRPPSAELMEVAEKFEARTEVTFQSKVDRVTGGRQLKFQEDVTAGAGGTIKVPDSLYLSLPVFEGGKPFELKARLEWVPRDGKLAITVHLHRAEEVLRAAFDAIRADIAAATGQLILTGDAR